MQYYPHQAAAGCKITVGNVAGTVYSFINTAASTTAVRAGFPADTNAIDITPETNDVRIMWGNTPTALLGQLLTAGTTYGFRGCNLDDLKLIRTGSDATVIVMLGKSDNGETNNAINY